MFKSNVQPYPGLRPFTEDEAIFFKGRDKQIKEIISQLELKKFVMVTGASGDGKSSIIYAGVIPNIRAGFFKADYNKWRFAELKPEKTPLTNLAEALSKSLNIDIETVTKKLGFGFSAIIDLYKSSEFYLDKKSDEWKNGSIEDKKALKKNAANLFILIDQFEEFFTNNENYSNGKPSIESQTVVNVLLETAKIALEEKLPIYIVNTMRSDFIGQCASFRGLPEYIGFSEFFIPRLKRKEIVNVIQEPAILSGTKISRRLVEVLINELHDGFDQLPVLQHALSQIWKLANEEDSEMDFIHLAKIGGLNKDYLPEDDKLIFQNWYDDIVKEDKPYVTEFIDIFKRPSLENVLDSHANELYLTAYENFITENPQYKETVSEEQSQFIIKTVFQSLTKIDGGRAVRYRMSLQEITDIINIPSIDYKIVGRLIKIFRKQGTTFIYPFINTEDSTTKELKPETILDITHESLIRNWGKLKEWAEEEHSNRVNYLDFEKQFIRWSDNDKKKGFLLPIGSLTFFEDWYLKAQPNKYWLAKYDERKITKVDKLKDADSKLKIGTGFIKKSASKLIITRTFMRYGAAKIVTVIGLIALFASITYFYNDFQKKTNKYILNKVETEGLELLNSRKINTTTKAKFIINYERLHPNSYKKILSNMPDSLAYDVSFEMFKALDNFDDVTDTINPLIMPVYSYMDSVLTGIVKQSLKNKMTKTEDLKRINNFLLTTLFIKNNSKINMDSVLNMIKNNLYEIVITKLNQKTDFINDPKTFNYSVELLTLILDNKSKVKNIISLLSPYNAENNDSIFYKKYVVDKRVMIEYNLSLTHNAGYHLLSELYASVGDFNKVNSCLDSVIKYSPKYKNTNDLYFSLINGYIDNNGFNDLANRFAKIKLITLFEIYEEINRATFKNKIYLRDIRNDNEYNNPPINTFLSMNEANKIWDKYYNLIKENNKVEDKNYAMVIYYKKRGFYNYSILNNIEEANKYFELAFSYYEKMNKESLEKEVVVGNEKVKVKRKLMFLYPRIIWEGNSWNIWDINTYRNTFNDFRKIGFLEFITSNPEYQKYYNDKYVLKTMEYFYYSYYNNMKNDFLNDGEDKLFNYGYLDFAKSLLDRNNYKYDSTFYQLVEFEKQIIASDTSKAFAIYNSINKDFLLKNEFQNAEDPKESANKVILQRTIKYLALNGKLDESMTLLYALKEDYQRRNTLIDITYHLQTQGPIENTFIYLDSLYSDIDRNNKYGQKLFRAMGKIGSTEVINLANATIKNTNDYKKPSSYKNLIMGILEADNYYLAYTQIPKYVSLQKDLDYYSEFMHTKIVSKSIKDKGWYKVGNIDNYIWTDYDFENGGDGYFAYIED